MRTLVFGVTWDNISLCDCTVVVLNFYNPGGGSIFLSGMVGSVTHGPYCDVRLQFCYQKFIVIVVYRLFYHTLHVPDIIIDL